MRQLNWFDRKDTDSAGLRPTDFTPVAAMGLPDGPQLVFVIFPALLAHVR
jgi:hypothetical protein